MLVRLLRTGMYDPKKTACFALGNLIRNHPQNQAKAVHEGAVTLLTELINDEEDDELSKKAYECLELVGEKVIDKQMDLVERAIQSREMSKWKAARTIIVDVFGRRERHIYIKQTNSVPNLRYFGP